MKLFLGVEVVQNDKEIYLSKKKDVMEILERFNLKNGNSVHNPMVPGIKLMKNKHEKQVI